MWLQTTIGGAGRLSGDLTGPAAAALAAVLAALGAKGGPEDTRTLPSASTMRSAKPASG